MVYLIQATSPLLNGGYKFSLRDMSVDLLEDNRPDLAGFTVVVASPTRHGEYRIFANRVPHLAFPVGVGGSPLWLCIGLHRQHQVDEMDRLRDSSGSGIFAPRLLSCQRAGCGILGTLHCNAGLHGEHRPITPYPVYPTPELYACEPPDNQDNRNEHSNPNPRHQLPASCRCDGSYDEIVAYRTYMDVVSSTPAFRGRGRKEEVDLPTPWGVATKVLSGIQIHSTNIV